MSTHEATISWKREVEPFTYDTYNRGHDWTFGGGAKIRASAAPEFRGDPGSVNPEEALVAALSSCHMLTFLALAARRKLVVESYDDHAAGVLEKNAEGRLAITRVVLRPRVVFGGAEKPDHAALVALHEHAHKGCFIASSVKTEVTVEPREDDRA